MPRSSDKDVYEGVCSAEIKTDRSDEPPIDYVVQNYKKYSFRNGPDDSTRFKVSASAGYPFAEPLSPKIDFSLTIDVYVDFMSKRFEVAIVDEHILL